MMFWRCIASSFAALAATLSVASAPAFAASEGSFGGRAISYSGSASNSLTPTLGVGGDFGASIFLSNNLHLGNHFTFDFLIGGTNFADQFGPYNGYSAAYTLDFKYVIVPRSRIQPYFEVGPCLGLFVMLLSGQPNGFSQDQTALKYGFNIGIGADWLKNEHRGETTGWGIGVDYFDYFAGGIDFPAAKMSVKGIVLEIRWIWGISKTKTVASTEQP